jgi:OmpA-OmpF porin, OOP family
MSNNLLELLKEHLSGDVVSNLATQIGESPKNTETALNAALPSLLAGLAEKCSDGTSIDHLFNLLTDGKHDGGVLSNLGALSRGGDETDKLIADGGNFISSVFGNKTAGLANLVTNSSGISTSAATNLLQFITPIILGMLGRNLKINHIDNTAGLAGLLSGQNGFLINHIPSGFSKLFTNDTLEAAINKADNESVKDTITDTAKNILSEFDKATDIIDKEKIAVNTAKIGASIAETLDNIDDVIEDVAEEAISSVKEIAGNVGDSVGQMGSHVVTEGKEFAESAAHAFEEGAGESKKFLPWILIAAALALVWGLLKSCVGPTEIETPPEAIAPKFEMSAPPAQPVVTPAPEPTKIEPTPAEQVEAATSTFFEKVLSTGYSIKAANDGFISKFVGFIESNEAINKDLWFSMDGITFDTNKATIKKESDTQINDIAEILKAYPKVKIKIGGYTDNTGNAKANKKLSANRADAVKKALVAKSVKADRMDAEGYGSDHPVASNDTEEGRQQNRRIDVRVTEK